MTPTATVVCLHSTGAMPAMWDPYRGQLAALGTPVTPANLGYPPRPLVARGTTVSLQDDVDAALEHLPAGAADVHLVAHSYGGVLALALMQQRRAQIRSAFLFEPVLFGSLLSAPESSASAVAMLRTFLEDPAFLHDPVTGGEDAWIATFIDYWNRPGTWTRVPASRQAAMRAVGWKMFQEVQIVFRNERLLDDLTDVTIPVTLVYGEHSPPESRAVIALLASRLPTARVVAMPGVGHMAPMTHPHVVGPVLQAHLEGVLQHEALGRHPAR